MISDFNSFDIDEKIMHAIDEMGFKEPTPVQAAAIPIILSGRDVMAQAQTGTGKTAAFGIPLIELIEPGGPPSAIILVPTRELAVQVAHEISNLAKHTDLVSFPVYGGQSINVQFEQLERGVDVVVGTPGRVMDHIRRRTLDLSHARFAVLDEADRMLDMGFIEDIQFIMSHIPKDKRTWLFSATLGHDVREMAEEFMNDPEEVFIGEEEMVLSLTKQIYFSVGRRNKMWALCRVLDKYRPKAIIFCQTKRMVDILHDKLTSFDYRAEALHGDLSQAKRERVLDKFRKGDIDILIATDVAARGLDIEDVNIVFNYDIPDDPEIYVHRIGRTGRAGKEGTAITFVTSDEMHLLRRISEYGGQEVYEGKIPDGDGRDTIRRVIDWDEASDIFGMVTFEMNLGKADGFTTNGMIDWLIGTLRINAFAVGDVNVRDENTRFQIHKDMGTRTLRTLSKQRHKGKKVKIRALRD